ncbi:hypothetical protein [Pseudomonas sp. H3(2019)]|uniref:hypothetical protein n=1 Tax=Pseudomonas sp. H3(2019) TaxID=2598724 RepID=UPI00118FE64C|nr:hypothetical protein [Pseudomonas sp. H3(2019)]TVT83977.1 hypothetical protein FPT12_10215 [Pseudomonas sp. H3(2019)]
MQVRVLVAGLTFLSLTACSTSTPDAEKLSLSSHLMMAEGGEAAPVDDEEFRKKFESELEKTIDFCTPILSGMERDSVDGAKKAFGLSMAGLIAGAVIAPALAAANASANAGWIAGFSGFGGAAGFAGKNYESLGLNGRAQATQRNDIVDRIREQLKVALNSTQDKQNRLNALSAARVECVMYKASTPTLSTQ